MVGSVAGEVAIRVSQPRDLIRVLGAFRVIHDIRYSKPQPIDVKPHAVVHIRQIKSEVAEATDFEGLVQKNSANVKFIRRSRHDAHPKAHNSDLIYNVRALSTTLRQRMMEKWSVGVMVSQHSSTPMLHSRVFSSATTEKSILSSCGCPVPSAFSTRTKRAGTSCGKTRRRTLMC